MHCRQTVLYTFAYCSNERRQIHCTSYYLFELCSAGIMFDLIAGVFCPLKCILRVGLVSWLVLAIIETQHYQSIEQWIRRPLGSLH